MFIANKRVKVPSEIEVEGTLVKTVDNFKLLGVTLSTHCSNLKNIINRKMYSINRLFYLATSVKIQFFKTFILPYFDYCLSLIIYFPKSTFQSLNTFFNVKFKNLRISGSSPLGEIFLLIILMNVRKIQFIEMN